eukprot:1506215-Prymnesium_polylepis.2
MGSIVHACPMGSTFAPDRRAFHARRASHVPPAGGRGGRSHMARRGSRAHITPPQGVTPLSGCMIVVRTMPAQAMEA